MSKLQSNFTTPEQSKRLLELGVPADSADLFYDNAWLKIDKDDVPLVIYKTNKFTDYCQQEYTPCWSVGMLMKIFAICFDPDFIEFDIFADGTTFLQQMLDKFETCIDAMDFSKLEE